MWHVQLVLGISPNKTILCVSPGERKKKCHLTIFANPEPQAPAAFHVHPLLPSISESPQKGNHKQGTLFHMPFSVNMTVWEQFWGDKKQW